MKLTHLYNKEIVIERMVATTGNKVAYSTLTSTYAHLQPLSDEKSALFGGAYGKVYVAYCDISVDIKSDDKFRDSDNNIYIVKKGAMTTRNFGSIEYQKIIIEMV